MASLKRLFRRVRRSLGREINQKLGTDFSSKYRWDFNPDKKASQGGEDGLIDEILRRLRIDEGWFVEFGAWDGVHRSNTYALVQRRWHGVAIEGDPQKVEDLRRNMRPYSKVHCICRFVQAEGADRLAAILAETPTPHEFDVLSVDVDGNDYWLWRSLADYRPKLVIIEYNPNFEPWEQKTIAPDSNHRWDGTMYYGASAGALNQLAAEKGYTLVAYTPLLNLFFVRSDLVDDLFEPLTVERVRKRKLHKQTRRGEFIDPRLHP